MSTSLAATASTASAAPVHSDAYRLRRFLNWFPLGLAYALLYMGRYNLTVAKGVLGPVMSKEDFGIILGAGTLVYGVSFLFNGPLAERIGGRRAMLLSLTGSAIVNLFMGLYVSSAVGGDPDTFRLVFAILYSANMYFQSIAAVAIIKVNAYWFHVRERGGFSGIFGTMIASGLLFAFTINPWILSLATGGAGSAADTKWVFYTPAALLTLLLLVESFVLRDRPALAGHADFDTGDASSGDDDVRPVPALKLIGRILSHPVILIVMAIEFCTGILRNGVMHWTPIYAKESLVLPKSHWLIRDTPNLSGWPLHLAGLALAIVALRTSGRRRANLLIAGAALFLVPFVSWGWGGILFVAGVIGSNVAGWVSDLFFQSRRGPAAALLYGGLLATAVCLHFALGGPTDRVAWVAPTPGGTTTAEALVPEGGPRDRLVPGDQVVSVAGQPVRSWGDVTHAVACLPAACTGGAVFDAEKCLCTRNPTAPVAAAPSATIPARVVRGGQEIDLALPDPAKALRAGDARKLAAGPTHERSPLWLGLCVFFLSVCVIGAHGVLSGTASMDFGGRKGAATAAGIIDGAVYLGTAVQSFTLGYLTTRSWTLWPLFLVPFAVGGLVLARRIWNASPRASHA